MRLIFVKSAAVYISWIAHMHMHMHLLCVCCRCKGTGFLFSATQWVWISFVMVFPINLPIVLQCLPHFFFLSFAAGGKSSRLANIDNNDVSDHFWFHSRSHCCEQNGKLKRTKGKKNYKNKVEFKKTKSSAYTHANTQAHRDKRQSDLTSDNSRQFFPIWLLFLLLSKTKKSLNRGKWA